MTTLNADLTPHQASILGANIPDALDAAAREWPDRLALHEVEGQQRSLTWGELREAISRLRSGLEALGVKPGDRVGVLARNQVEFPIAWLAVIEAGAAMVPLNPKYTHREIDFVLRDAGATWLIGLGDLLAEHMVDGNVGPVASTGLVAIGGNGYDSDFETLARAEITERRQDVDPLEVVNIQFTSGTTGLPKGCMLTHQYWLHLGVYGAALDNDSQRMLADHPFYYMQNQAYLMIALAKGAALYITPGMSRRKFMGWLHEFQIDFAWIDEDMLDFPPDPRDGQLAMRRAPVAGLPAEAYAPIRERFGIRARECYASTEVGNGTTVPYDRDDLAGNGSMGFCFPDRESKVVGDDLEEVADGQPGELCFRGPGMMLGYHNRPEANAELFLPGGWFRTGDIVTRSADGEHFYVGRVRDMIRRSDESISAAEVEMHVSALPGVAEVAAVPVPDPVRGEEVKVIIVNEPAGSLSAEDVVTWAREGLAAFKVPRYVEFRSELPYTGSGKIHKAALKEEEEPVHAAVFDTQAGG